MEKIVRERMCVCVCTIHTCGLGEKKKKKKKGEKKKDLSFFPQFTPTSYSIPFLIFLV